MIAPRHGMVYLRGNHETLAGKVCFWCNCPIRHKDVDKNNPTVEFGYGTDKSIYVHKLCAPSYVSKYVPEAMESLKLLIND